MGLASRLVALSDRAILRVAGEGSGTFLQGLCTQDVLRRSGEVAAMPAAFLSPKGKVLCDTIIKQQDSNEYLVDCHSSVIGSLKRLLLRHKLRQPLTIDDVSKGYHSMALLPWATRDAAGTAPSAAAPSEFFADPRFGGMGHRAILPVSQVPVASGELSDYHFWRVCCGVPEGPRDLKIDEVMPLHANLDLLDFISFSKGCYVGQELLTRTKHRGAVRRRIFTVLAMDASAAPPKMPVKRSDPLTAESVVPTTESLQPTDDKDVVIFGQTNGDSKEPKEPKQVGTLLTTSENLALCMLRCEGAFNEVSSFEQAPLPENMKVISASAALQFLVRAPPYVFS